MKAYRSFVLALLGFIIAVQVQAQSITVHDPVMIRQDNTYYVFCTGMGISVFSSPDMKNWQKELPVFTQTPKWAVEAIPTFKGHIWAPDISYYNDQYYLYYSVSAFGKNTSCIGLATNRTLNTSDPEFRWIDHGKIIQSVPGETNWNAIDPNFILDETGTPYLCFGSFWDGLKLVRLSPDGMRVAEDIHQIPTIATRKSDPKAPNPPSVDNNPVEAGGNAIEAPFIFRRGNYYYLFASIDYCCKGVNSTYKMIVGRSAKLIGPYIDFSGREMIRGGGTILLHGDADWNGVGHNAVVSFDGSDFLVYHGYDAHDNGKPKLNIKKLNWNKDEWPVIDENYSLK